MTISDPDEWTCEGQADLLDELEAPAPRLVSAGPRGFGADEVSTSMPLRAQAPRRASRRPKRGGRNPEAQP
jgi:hypothetical protein